MLLIGRKSGSTTNAWGWLASHVINHSDPYRQRCVTGENALRSESSYVARCAMNMDDAS